MNDTTLNHLAENLLYAGWNRSEIERLVEFLNNYEQTHLNNYEQTLLDQAELNIRHLEFIRWLVLTGKLVD